MSAQHGSEESRLPGARRIPASLILIGYRGSGKTTVGRLAAKRLGWTFIDTDELIELAAGRSIASIFQTNGEAAFRDLESCAIQQAVAGRNRVISVGGGAVLSEVNRARLRAAGLCVWLTAPPEVLCRRMRNDPLSVSRRPALTEQAELEEIRQVLADREPLYQAVADRAVNTVGRSVDEIVRDVLAVVPGSSIVTDGA